MRRPRRDRTRKVGRGFGEKLADKVIDTLLREGVFSPVCAKCGTVHFDECATVKQYGMRVTRSLKVFAGYDQL